MGKKLPEKLVFWKDFGGKTDEPNHDDELRTLFTSSLWVSEKALRFFGEHTLIKCSEYLREQAKIFNGINDFQKIFDETENLPPLLFLEEGTDDPGVCNMLYRSPTRVVAMLRDEYDVYDLRYGSEDIGLRIIEKI